MTSSVNQSKAKNSSCLFIKSLLKQNFFSIFWLCPILLENFEMKVIVHSKLEYFNYRIRKVDFEFLRFFLNQKGGCNPY